jgi:preprotein translocase subunit SecG
MLLAAFSQYFFGFTIFITSLFLIMLVLVQRGRGGGLTGALGGPGGQSAFGTKAGDLFTRITVGVAAVWIFLCAAAVFFLKDRELPQTNVLGNVPSVMEPGEDNADIGPLDGGSSDLSVPLNLPSGGAAPAEPQAEINDATSLDLSPSQPATDSESAGEVTSPATTEPATTEPTATEPTATEPTATEPAAAEAGASEPSPTGNP